MVPGALPLSSSSLGEVTIASATSGLVSETRVMAAPTSRTVERPTITLTVRVAWSLAGASAFAAAIVAAACGAASCA